MSDLEPDERATQCPGCESYQRFLIRSEKTDIPGVELTFISCNVCPFRKAIGYTTHDIEYMRGKVRMLALKAKVLEDRHNMVPETLQRRLDEARQERNQLVADLQLRLKELGHDGSLPY